MQSRYTYVGHASASHSILVVSLWKVSPCLKTVWTLCMASISSLCKCTRLVHVELQWNFYLLWHVTNLQVTCLNCWSSVTDFKRLLPVSLIHANFHHTWRCLKSDQIVIRVSAFLSVLKACVSVISLCTSCYLLRTVYTSLFYSLIASVTSIENHTQPSAPQGQKTKASCTSLISQRQAP